MVATAQRKIVPTHDRTFDIPLNKIVPSPFQPRQFFDEEALQEMAVSIKKSGRLVQPVVVRPVGKKFQIVAGERRLRAAKMAGLPSVSAIVRNLSDKEALEESSIENLQRENLRPSEEGRAIQNLLRLGKNLEEISARIGKSVQYLQVRLDLIELPREIQTLADKEEINLAHTEVIKELPTTRDQKEAARMAAEQRLTATQLKARTQHKLMPRRRSFHTESRGYTAENLSRDIITLHANISAFKIDPQTPPARRQTLSKQITVLIKALQKVQHSLGV